MGLIHSPSIVTSNLIWCLDAGNTKSYPGSGTLWYDLSGNNRTSTLQDGPTFANGALTFDGLNDRIAGPTDIKWTQDGSVGFTSLTIELWARTTDTTGYLYGKPWNGNGAYNIQINLNNTFSVSCFSGAAGLALPTSVTDGNWKQIVCWINSTQFSAYVNGNNFVRTATNHGLTGGVTAVAPGDLSLSTALMTLYPYPPGWAGSAALSCAGDLANVKVYNRVLTAEEVRQNFNALRGRFGI